MSSVEVINYTFKNIFLYCEQLHLSFGSIKTMGSGIQQAFYKHQDDNEQMSKNQLILNLQMANFLSKLEKLQAHGICLALCAAVQIHSWSAKTSGKYCWR